jgi:hypothetical protein
MTDPGGNDQDDALRRGRLNRPQRNNNPGNIEYGPFARSQGATGKEPEGRFAVFASPQEGFRALVNLLQTDSYQSRTLGAAIHRFAPPSENNTAAYIRYMENKTGIPRHTRLSDLSPQELENVARAKAAYEGWRPARSGEKLALIHDEDRIPRWAGRSESEGAGKSLKDRFAQQADDRPTANRTGKEAAPATPSLKQAVQDRYAEAQNNPPAQQPVPSSTLPAGAKHERNGFNDQTWPTAASHYADEGGIKVARNATQDFAPAAAGASTPEVQKPVTPAPAFRLEEPGWNG